MSTRPTNPDGKFILNYVQRPTTPFDAVENIEEYLTTIAGKRSFVDLSKGDEGEILVKSSKGMLLGKLTPESYAVYGDILEQIIESGLTPSVDSTIEIINGETFAWLHLRQDPKDLTWGKFRPRPTKSQLEMQRRIEESERRMKLTKALKEYESKRKKGFLARLNPQATKEQNLELWNSITAKHGVPGAEAPEP